MTPTPQQRLYGQAYRARTEAECRGLEATISTEQWRMTIEVFDSFCAYCGDSGVALVLDHFIPLNRGGPAVYGNCIPACADCNREKGVRDPYRPGFWSHFPNAVQDQILTMAGGIVPGAWEASHHPKSPMSVIAICGVQGELFSGATQSVTCDVCAADLERQGFKTKR